MRAATKEVQSILESAGEKISLDGKHISLNRKQLDSMPVLGMIILSRSTRNHATLFTVFCLLPHKCLLRHYYGISQETLERNPIYSLAIANAISLPNVPGGTESIKIHMNGTFLAVMACLNTATQLRNIVLETHG